VTGGVRQKTADTRTVPVNDDETAGSSAAEMLAMAEEAEAEATEAEALATAARARARAIKLRRDADRAEATKRKPAARPTTKAARTTRTTRTVKVADDAGEAAAEPEPAAPVAETQAAETLSAESPAAEDAVEAESVEPTEAEPVAEIEPTADDDEAEATEELTEDEADEGEAKPFRRLSPRRLRRPRWSSVAAIAAMVVIVAALAGSAYMILEHRRADQQHVREAEFVAAARQGVVNLTSLDFSDAKTGVQRIVDDSTGSFKDDFLKMAGDFVKVVQESKVVSRGTVQSAAVDLDSMTRDSAVVLVACTSEVTNAAGAKQDPRTYRLIVTMARDGGRLKMSKVEFVP
jgi:Mce-associated membrane protein